jgi:hypothetical protein
MFCGAPVGSGSSRRKPHVETSFRSPHRTAGHGSSGRLPSRAGQRRSRRLARRFAIVAAALALPLTTACAANFSAQTQQQYQPAVGSDDRAGMVYALNMLVVADTSGNGTLVGTLINQDACPDYVTDLQAVDADGGGVKTSTLPTTETLDSSDDCPDVSAPSNGIALPSQIAVKLPDDAQVQFSADTVTPGSFITVTMRFARADQLELDVPVVSESDMYDGVTVGPISGTQ